MITKNWYAIYVKTRYEKKVLAFLENKRVECYLPLKQEVRQWSDRKKLVEEPLISGYLFVKLDYRYYYDVLVVPGVINFVRFENQLAIIPDYQIEDLKIFLRNGGQQLEVSSDRICKGATIRVSQGAFCGVIGEVAEIRGKKKIVIRIKALGCSILAELGKNEVIPWQEPLATSFHRSKTPSGPPSYQR